VEKTEDLDKTLKSTQGPAIRIIIPEYSKENFPSMRADDVSISRCKTTLSPVTESSSAQAKQQEIAQFSPFLKYPEGPKKLRGYRHFIKNVQLCLPYFIT
jgi:hypothetical protein